MGLFDERVLAVLGEGKPKFFAPACGIAAIIFATALPFYLMLKDSKVS